MQQRVTLTSSADPVSLDVIKIKMKGTMAKNGKKGSKTRVKVLINRARVYWTSVKEKVIYFLENLKVVKIRKLVQLLQISYEAGSGITT